jgi:hypothetical protein
MLVNVASGGAASDTPAAAMAAPTVAMMILGFIFNLLDYGVPNPLNDIVEPEVMKSK